MAIAFRILRDFDLADDAVQSALLTAWRELRTLRDPERFEPWLHRILTNACYAEARRRRRWSSEIALLTVEPVHGTDEYATVDNRDQLGPGDPTPTPEPTATSEPSPSSAAAPPLTQSFTSTQHGISISYPEGWTAQAATEPWTDPAFPLEFGGSHADFLSDPTLESSLFLTMASQPIGESTAEDWVVDQLASGEGCASTGPIAVDGATGLIGVGECNVAVVTSDGRGYWIQLYTSGDDPSAVNAYDRAWFEEVLATVQLRPEDAVE